MSNSYPEPKQRGGSPLCTIDETLTYSTRTETLRVAMSVWQLISHQTVPQLAINSHGKLEMDFIKAMANWQWILNNNSHGKLAIEQAGW